MFYRKSVNSPLAALSTIKTPATFKHYSRVQQKSRKINSLSPPHELTPELLQKLVSDKPASKTPELVIVQQTPATIRESTSPPVHECNAKISLAMTPGLSTPVPIKQHSSLLQVLREESSSNIPAISAKKIEPATNNVREEIRKSGTEPAMTPELTTMQQSTLYFKQQSSGKSSSPPTQVNCTAPSITRDGPATQVKCNTPSITRKGPATCNRTPRLLTLQQLQEEHCKKTGSGKIISLRELAAITRYAFIEHIR